ncbi:MAG: hypothetical protein ERJ69_02185 [Aphanocapsa feldmannii 288cV]|nr:MAG: hypothetical protein ERJ69_02185 [Aphanocapsa feldmannii 288cV]
MIEKLANGGDQAAPKEVSIAELFLDASRELARSDARIYRSVDRHLTRTREILNRAESELKDSLLLEEPCQALQVQYSYERQTRKSLESLCRIHRIRGYSRMTKKLIIMHLKAKGVPDPAVPIEAFTKNELIALLRNVLHRHQE